MTQRRGKARVPVLAELGNDRVRLIIRRGRRGLVQEFQAAAGRDWIPVMTGALSPVMSGGQGEPVGDLAIGDGQRTFELGYSELEDRSKEASLCLALRHGRGGCCETEITLLDDWPGFHVTTQAQFRPGSNVEFVQGQYHFLPKPPADREPPRPEFVWVPNLRPRPDYVIAEHVFRSPAVILQEATLLAALVPDLDIVAIAQPLRSALDLQIEARGPYPCLSYGLKNFRPDGHVFYQHSPTMTIRATQQPLVYSYFLLLSAAAPQRLGYREIVRFLWDRYAQRYVRDHRPQMISFDRYARYGYDHAFKRARLWVKVPLGKGEVGGTTSRYNEGTGETDHKIWYQGWLNNVRTAYGLGWYGRKWRDAALARKASAMIRLATRLPQVEGAFPAICIPANPPQWKKGTRGWEVLDDVYSVTDNAWTCYWLLRWYKDIQHDPAILKFCENFAQLLLRTQTPRGAFPSWVETVPNLVHVVPDLAEEATTAVGSMVLCELYPLRRQPEVLAAIDRSVRFLLREVVPEQRWWDFEAFYSPCVRHFMGLRDPYTGLFRQNNLSIFWTASALHSLYRLTGRRGYLLAGQQVLDYLCLFQQIWSASFISVYSFGGFGVLNTDAEWNDNRSTMFAPLFLDYYTSTGWPEYFHRGVAALRAGYALMYVPENRPMSGVLEQGKLTAKDHGLQYEHYAHAGLDVPIYGHVLFDWGSGSTASAAALIEARYGGLYVDVPRKQAFGIDGCTVTKCRVDGVRLHIEVSHVADHGGTTLKATGASGPMEVVLNGRALGRFSSRDLQRGVPICFRE